LNDHIVKIIQGMPCASRFINFRHHWVIGKSHEI